MNELSGFEVGETFAEWRMLFTQYALHNATLIVKCFETARTSYEFFWSPINREIRKTYKQNFEREMRQWEAKVIVIVLQSLLEELDKEK